MFSRNDFYAPQPKMAAGPRGFTLVELAIAVTVVGILVGGVLKGAEMIRNARVTGTITQVKMYESAMANFRDKYMSMPGDMRNAGSRLPNCPGANGENCNAPPATAGNRKIGRATWASGWNTQTAAFTPGAATEANETTLFWAHMALADMVQGISAAAVMDRATPTWGVTHPAAKIGGGFVVGYASGTRLPGINTGNGPKGTLLMLVTTPTSGGSAALQVAKQQPINSRQAVQIDRKIDDGRPDSGFVYAYGRRHASGCVQSGGGGGVVVVPGGKTGKGGGMGKGKIIVTPAPAPAPASPVAYNESVQTNDCGLAFVLREGR